VKTAKNSKLPKLPKNCFEPVGKGGWPLISIWITLPMKKKICLEKEYYLISAAVVSPLNRAQTFESTIIQSLGLA
jgi:hypothetical protein